MSRKNRLIEATPHPVEEALKQLGQNLREARVRRNMTIAEAADRIGTGPRAIMDAEKGKPATGMVVYAALLWLYDQLYQLEEVADPYRDEEGRILESGRKRQRVRKLKGLNNDF